MTAFLLAAQLTLTPVPCAPPQPGSSWVCQDGGWLPPGHPSIRPTQPPPPPPPPQGALVPEFQIGRTYRRDATGTRLHILALGTAKSGVAVLATECLDEAAQDQCYFPGQGRLILANASAAGWSVEP